MGMISTIAKHWIISNSQNIDGQVFISLVWQLTTHSFDFYSYLHLWIKCEHEISNNFSAKNLEQYWYSYSTKNREQSSIV